MVRDKGRNTKEVGTMAAEKKGSRIRGKESTVPRKRERTGRSIGEDVELGPGAAVIDVDPWSSFFEKFWEQAEGETADDGRSGPRVSSKGPQTPSTKARR